MSRAAAILIVALVCAALARGAAPPDGAGAAAVTALRGIAGAVEFVAGGEPIRARANQEMTTPLLVRVADASRLEDGQTRYRVEFIGLVAGEYDLRDYLERAQGDALGIAPLPILVVSQLPEQHGVDLFSSAQTPQLAATRYRVVMAALAALWLAAPVVYFVVRVLRRRPPPPPPIIVPPPTLAEQLRPLVESAVQGTLTTAQRGRLELLLYLYWRERLGLSGSQAEIVARLRHDPRAGELLRAVEHWLHSGRAATAQPETELARLLEPYRYAPAIDVEAVAPEGRA